MASKTTNKKLINFTFEETKEIYFRYISNEESRNNIERAFLFAKKVHKGQFRKSGEPYYHHLVDVCHILAENNCGPSTLIAGLLHDTVEDTEVTIEQIENLFGADVSKIVDSLTKIQRLKLSHKSEEEFVAEDHRKIFLGMAKDVRVIVIKLADRLHNMRTLSSLKPERQYALSRETMEVFAPIAHRLGMNAIKSELEDLSLKYLKPEIYEDILTKINSKTKNGQKSLDSISKRIADLLFEKNIPFEMKWRSKSITSIYKKIYNKNHKFDEIFDLFAIRIITETELNCYEILGIIHATFKPIPGRFKDYIAVPKPNMYQSLHTCIISGDGNIFEIQIRTKDMDEVAENGIAAHWRYKEGTNYNPKQEQKEIEEQLHWFKDFINISEENYGAKDYIDTLTQDIFEANVYVFTPLGKVIDLPNGSTPLDFAYKIHTRVGESTIGAIVNNVMVPLNTVLKTGDIVEIKTSKTSSGPNEGWLNIAKTNFAKAHIRKFLMKKNNELLKDEKILKGKNMLIDAFRLVGLDEKQMIEKLEVESVLKRLNFDEYNDFYIAISNKNPTAGSIVELLKLRPKEELKLNKEVGNSSCPVYLEKAGTVAINLGSCCTPIPGDEIIGYITKGKGITVHRIDCPNITRTKRLIEVKWKENLGDNSYPVDIKMNCEDRNNLLVDVMSIFSSKKIPVTSINARLHPNTHTTSIFATIYVKNNNQLQDIFNVLKNINNIFEIERIIH